MVVRLSDISSKTGKKCIFGVFRLFLSFVGQPHSHISWAIPMPFTSINSTNPRTNPWNFHEKILRIGGAGKWGFFEGAILNFFFDFFDFFSLHLMKKSSPFIWDIIVLCTMNGFFRILEKRLSELICTRLYNKLQFPSCLKYGFCNKSFRKDETLTSWTLLQPICPHFWAWLPFSNSCAKNHHDLLLFFWHKN